MAEDKPSTALAETSVPSQPFTVEHLQELIAEIQCVNRNYSSTIQRLATLLNEQLLQDANLINTNRRSHIIVPAENPIVITEDQQRIEVSDQRLTQSDEETTSSEPPTENLLVDTPSTFPEEMSNTEDPMTTMSTMPEKLSPIPEESLIAEETACSVLTPPIIKTIPTAESRPIQKSLAEIPLPLETLPEPKNHDEKTVEKPIYTGTIRKIPTTSKPSSAVQTLTESTKKLGNTDEHDGKQPTSQEKSEVAAPPNLPHPRRDPTPPRNSEIAASPSTSNSSENPSSSNPRRDPSRSPLRTSDNRTPKRKSPPRRDPPSEADRPIRPRFNTTPRPGCWNCGDPSHRYPACTNLFLHRFCFHCGYSGHTSRSCPNCNGKDLKEGRDYFRKSRKD